MDSPKTITALSLCSGYEGLGLGLRRVLPGLRVVAYSEIEAYACANLVSKMESGLLDAAPIWTDLKTFPCEQFHGLVDIITGGYPCQPESCAGKKMGKEDTRWIWPYIRRAVHIIRPSLCFFENVEGHITGGLRSVLTDLSALGYRVASQRGEPTWGIFSAAEVGAPHRRKRVFVLAYRKDCQRWLQLCAGHWRQGSELAGRGGSVGNSEQPRTDADSPISGPRDSVSQPGGDLADTDIGLRDWSGNAGPGRRGQHPDGSTELGNAESDDQRRNTMPGIDGQGIEAGGSGGNVADSGRNGGETRRPDESLRSAHESRNGHWDGLPEFPPGPNDAAAWARVPPELWPATAKLPVRSLAYGPATDLVFADRYRVDALRSAGNGVVPATAAKAFMTLMNRIVKP